jgi:hypothetical protein
VGTTCWKKETNSLACACHSLKRGWWKRTRQPSMEAEDANETIGEVRVVQKLMEERRYKSKDFDLTT